jgi:hypothetical protein
MLAVVGTVPDQDFPLAMGKVALEDDVISIQGNHAPVYRAVVNRGTPALLAAAIKVGEVVGQPPPVAYLVGDIGLGDGSRRLYAFLSENSAKWDVNAVAFHYLQPDVDWHNRVLFALEEMTHRPVLIADAGFMYAAKMSGQAASYDFFTPDVGELAFLADEMAPHPFYTRGFILHQNDNVPDLIQRAYQHQNAAATLLVKGQTDYIANKKQVLAKIDHPSFEAMEAIGGTGDTLTGLLTVLCGADFKPKEAAVTAANVNRWAGYYADPNPATQVMALIDQIPRALSKVFDASDKQNRNGGR